MGRVYLTFASISLLLLLTWHYSIQVTAHNHAKDKVFTWLQSMGGSAERVEFRMLRGALSIHNIKAELHGGLLHIDKIFIKGNPDSITANVPQLQQINVENLTYNATNIHTPFQALNTLISKSLMQIFYHTKHIHFQDVNIHDLGTLPPITVTALDITGSKQLRHISGNGFVGASANSWQLESQFPKQASQQQGNISSTFEDITSNITWSGSTQSNNFQTTIHQQNNDAATLDISIEQQKQWSAKFSANEWDLNLPQLETTLTGKGEILGSSTHWMLLSKHLIMDNSYFPKSEIFVSHITSESLKANLHDKSISIKKLATQDIILNLNTQQTFRFLPSWDINIATMDINELETAIYIQDEPITLPVLHGSAKVQHSELQFDLSSHGDDTQFIRLQKGKAPAVNISAEKIPLHHLRNMMPQPIQNKVLSMQGQVKLSLQVSPTNHWSTLGTVDISNLLLSSKNQTFSAQEMKLHLIKADIQGVQQARLVMNGWKLELPLTPRQAWGSESHLDDWASIPWQFERINMNHGEITIGGENRLWFKDSNISIRGWQSPSTANLSFDSQFGLAPFHASAKLQRNENHIMQWETIKVKANHANLFSLSDWLELSGLPRVQKGQISLNIHAFRNENSTKGTADIYVSHLQPEPMITQHDFSTQAFGASSKEVIQRLTKKNAIQYHLSLDAEKSSAFHQTIAHALLIDTQNQLSKATLSAKVKPRNSHNLGSIRIHQNASFSHNERTRLRKIIQRAKQRGWHIQLTPDLGTAELSPTLTRQIYQTQTMIKHFMSARGIQFKNIFLISAQQNQQSKSSNSAVHIHLVK